MNAQNVMFAPRNPGSAAGMTYGAGAAVVLPHPVRGQKTTGPSRRTTPTMTKKPTTSSKTP
jgi:hypothetical protein